MFEEFQAPAFYITNTGVLNASVRVPPSFFLPDLPLTLDGGSRASPASSTKDGTISARRLRVQPLHSFTLTRQSRIAEAPAPLRVPDRVQHLFRARAFPSRRALLRALNSAFSGAIQDSDGGINSNSILDGPTRDRGDNFNSPLSTHTPLPFDTTPPITTTPTTMDATPYPTPSTPASASTTAAAATATSHTTPDATPLTITAAENSHTTPAATASTT